MNYLEEIGNKDSEYDSLLAYEQVFYFQFVKRQDMFIFMNKLSKSLKLAMELGASNPRAFFVNGYYDYYTPKEYGGKKKTEELLLKAINLNNSPRPFAPTWGVADSYSLLIQYYLENGDKAKANAMFLQAIKLFPTSRDILRLKKQL
jgi:tetratricopeptide (TPR) repeat protein